MKTRFYFLLPVALVFAFISCSDGGAGGSGGNSDSGFSTDGKDIEQLMEDAAKSLENNKWGEAIEYYNAAYNENPNDARAIIYSTLANLAKISVDPKVVDLMKNNFGFTDYPTKPNALFSDSWMKETPSIEFWYYDPSLGNYVDWYRKGESIWCDGEQSVSKSGYYYCKWNYQNGVYTNQLELVSTTPRLDYERLPGVKTPNWITGSGSLYDSYLINGTVFSVDNWALTIIANVIDRNSNGFNNTLDEVIDAVFGVSYKEAVNRLKKLESNKEKRIHLDPSFIEAFELGEIFDEYDQIGWAEVNAVLSAVLAVKASLEWVQTYDLNTDLNWLKFAWSEDELEQQFINKFKALSATQVPFTNNFLKVRSGKTMETSKATYVAAIEGLQASFKSIQSSDLYPSEVKDAYTAINDGFNKLIAAIKNGGKFYIPKDDPTEISVWPTTSSNAQATIDLGKFFTSGYFSLQNIFETSSSKPVFYLRREVETQVPYDYCYLDWDYDEDGEYYEFIHCDKYYMPSYSYEYIPLSTSNYEREISKGGRLSLKLNTSKITAIVDQIPEEDFEYVDLGFSKEHAKAIVEKYYK